MSGGENARIDAYVTITGDVSLGKDIHIGTGCCIFGGGGVSIGDGTGISPGVKMFTSSDGNPQVPHESTNAPITIGKNCLIGTNSVIMPGAVIGDGAKIGALSLVKGVVPAGALYGGVPAKPLRKKP